MLDVISYVVSNSYFLLSCNRMDYSKLACQSKTPLRAMHDILLHTLSSFRMCRLFSFYSVHSNHTKWLAVSQGIQSYLCQCLKLEFAFIFSFFLPSGLFISLSLISFPFFWPPVPWLPFYLFPSPPPLASLSFSLFCSII